MSATTTAREAKRKDGEVISYKMAAVKIPKGALVSINADGFATNSTDAVEAFAGVAYETVDNSAGSAGDLSIRVCTTGTQTDVGVAFHVVDNQTVTDAATSNNLVAGVAVESISATAVRIRIDRYAS